jgi:hypothetical protein
MLDNDGNAQEFIERFRSGEFDDDGLTEALDSLTHQQREDLLRALEDMPEDLNTGSRSSS